MHLFTRRDIWLIPLLYIVYGLFLTVLQNNFIYHPDNTPPSQCKTSGKILSRETNNMRGYYHPKDDSNTLVVIYHGNAGNACHRHFYVNHIHEAEHSLLIVEYPGYAEPSKPRTKDILKYTYDVADEVSNLDYENLILIGVSIGNGFASYHATHQPVEHLIMITPFARLSDVTQSIMPIYPTSWMLRPNLEVAKWSQNAQRKTIIAGDNDEIIPIRHAKKLFSELAIPQENFIIIEDATHNTIHQKKQFHQTLSKVLLKQ